MILIDKRSEIVLPVLRTLTLNKVLGVRARSFQPDKSGHQLFGCSVESILACALGLATATSRPLEVVNALDVGMHLGLSPRAPGRVYSERKLQHGIATVLEIVVPQ